MNQVANNKETQRLLIVSGVVDLSLGIVKVLIGFLANSHALIADGIHSLSDLVTDVMVWIFNRVGTQAPDEDHPYGHGRFETFGTFILGILLITVAAALIYDSINRLMSIDEISTPTWPALVAAGISIISKEWLYQVTRKLGRKIRSNLLIANAWHHRSDSLSSFIVLAGVAGAMMGVTWLEMVAAIGVALMIANIGWSLSRQAVAELVDTALSAEDISRIQHSIEQAEGVRGAHNLRSRKMGADVFLDIHLQVDSAISVSEGHHIGEWVTKDLLEQFPDINDVVVHIDAEDDEIIEQRDLPASMPPLRREAREALFDTWQGLVKADEIRKLTLHYLNNGISVEIFLQPGTKNNDNQALEKALNEKAKSLWWFHQVSVWKDLSHTRQA